MVMRFQRSWDFNPGNKKLMLNDLTQDSDVIQALQEALSIAVTGVAHQIPYSNLVSGLGATDVQAALDELLSEIMLRGDGADGPPGPPGPAGPQGEPGAAVGLDVEGVMDLLGGGALIGDGVTLTYDDTAGTLTLAVDVPEPPPPSVEAIGTITKLEGPITQAAYDALTPDADTLYVIVG
jgi:hypothetical protein